MSLQQPQASQSLLPSQGSMMTVKACQTLGGVGIACFSCKDLCQHNPLKIMYFSLVTVVVGALEVLVG